MWSSWLRSYPDTGLISPAALLPGADAPVAPALSPLVQSFLPHDERLLLRAVQALAAGQEGEARRMTLEAAAGGSLLPDLKLLAGAFLMQSARFAEAADVLADCYRTDAPLGAAIRRMAPALRIQLRIEPCTLMPLYPGPHCAALMYALALWQRGQAAEALEVLREMTALWGVLDELRLMAGQIYIERGEPERAIQALTAQAVSSRDSVELARSLHLAYAHYLLEEFRSSARVLTAALSMQDANNPLLVARCSLLLAELYERNGLPLEALRRSGLISTEEVPQEVAAVMLQREQRWLAELSHLSNSELERMATADAYQVYTPEVKAKREQSLLDSSRDAGHKLVPREQSWLRRREEEEEIAAMKAALARGEDVELPGREPLTPAGADIKRRIARAQEWWPGRKAELAAAPLNSALARRGNAEVTHLAFDFAGTREAEPHRLQGEVRAALATAVGSAALIIFIVLIVLRSCVTLVQ